jgi:hypothetical protein
MSVEELLKWRDRDKAEYASEMRAEKIRRGEGLSNKIRVRF